MKTFKDSARYTMTHGEMLPATAVDDTIPLKTVVLLLYSRENFEDLARIKAEPLKIPGNSKVVLNYQKNDGSTATISGEKLLHLSDDEVKEINLALSSADKNSRPVISYQNSNPKIGLPTRLVSAYTRGTWECVLATNVSYAEVNFIYELLHLHGLCV